jgi:hypothetical protein
MSTYSLVIKRKSDLSPSKATVIPLTIGKTPKQLLSFTEDYAIYGSSVEYVDLVDDDTYEIMATAEKGSLTFISQLLLSRMNENNKIRKVAGRDDWFDVWYDDNRIVLLTMYENLASDLRAGYKIEGNSVKKQQATIQEYIEDINGCLEWAKETTPNYLNRWCYNDLVKRGAIAPLNR